MKGIIKFLNGKKTYLAAFAVASVAFASFMGWIDADLATLLYGIFGAGGAVSMRMALNKALG